MTTSQESEFIRLFLLSQDISTTAVNKYVRLKLLSSYNGDLIQYLNSDDIKHIFLHRWQKFALCCICPPEGCTSLKNISHKVFQTFYDVDKKSNKFPDHFEYSGARITQYCIHAFIPKKGVALEKLDLYMLMCLLEHCMAALSQQDKKCLEDVRNIRNDICHCKSTRYTETDIRIKWTDLETAIQYLDHTNDTKHLIKELKEKTFNQTESDKFLKNIEQLGREEDDEGFGIACLNLRTLKWFAQLYRTISSRNIELDTTPSVESMLQAIDSSIACGIEFKNFTKFILHKPSCKVVNGLIPNPPKPMSSWGNSFMMAHKKTRSIYGTSGVVSWEIENKDIRVAVMWSISSQISRNKNTLAVGFLREVDENVFDMMYKSPLCYGKNISRAEYSSDCSYISCIKENLEIIGIMGNSKKTVICIELKENDSQSIN